MAGYGRWPGMSNCFKKKHCLNSPAPLAYLCVLKGISALVEEFLVSLSLSFLARTSPPFNHIV
jgi:hypothetical protein